MNIYYEYGKQQRDKNMKLDKDFLNKVAPTIRQCWDEISPDASDVESNKEALEMCLDSDQITMNVTAAEREVVDALLFQADEEHGYEKVQAFLNKHIRLL